MVGESSKQQTERTIRCFFMGRGRALPTPARAPTTPMGTLGEREAGVGGCITPSSSSRFRLLPGMGMLDRWGGAVVGTAERGVALVGVDVDWVTDPGGGMDTGATRGFACDSCDVPDCC